MLFPMRIYAIIIGFATEVIFVEPENATGRYSTRELDEHGNGAIPVPIANVVENRWEGRWVIEDILLSPPQPSP
jgi:hypothetical protein